MVNTIGIRADDLHAFVQIQVHQAKQQQVAREGNGIGEGRIIHERVAAAALAETAIGDDFQ